MLREGSVMVMPSALRGLDELGGGARDYAAPTLERLVQPPATDFEPSEPEQAFAQACLGWPEPQCVRPVFPAPAPSR